MKVLFSIGGFHIYIFGFFIALGMLAGYMVVMNESKRRGYDKEEVASFILYAIVSGVIGARLYYILVFNLEYYINNPMKILAFRDGGLSIQGALITGILVTFIYAKVKKINIWKMADVLVPGIIIGQAIGRIGCDVFGVPMSSDYFWGVTYNNQLLHPAQVYEVILNFILFGVIWAKRKNTRYDGQLFFIYIIGFSINRFIVEFFRANPLVIETLTVAHVTSIAIIILAYLTMQLLKRKYNVNKPKLEKAFEISIKEIIAIISLTLISVVTYYWIWL